MWYNTCILNILKGSVSVSFNKEIALEILPDSYKYIAELIGLEKAIIILENFGGSTIYIPKIDCCTRYHRNIKIVSDYRSGKTYSQIAIKYDLTSVSVRNIISSFQWSILSPIALQDLAI